MKELTKRSDYTFSTGDIINGKFLLIERIGKGGMGEVYRAHQLNLNRDVAIKLVSEGLLQELEDNPEEVEAAFGRFQREVQTMAKVRHPNVIQIYDYGSVSIKRTGHDKQVEYISMEYIPGNTFRFTMSEYGFKDEEALLAEWLLMYFLPVLDGVAAIHAHGIVHRDMKPENILMDGEIPKISDFGLARALQIRAVSNSWDVKGTWPYMAPEQFADFRKAGREADIYALGKILYEAVSGKLDNKHVPFKAAGLQDPQTPMLKSLDGVIRKATCERKEDRFQSADELSRAVQAALGAKDAAARPQSASPPVLVRWMWAGIVTTLLALGGMTAYHVWEAFRPPTIAGNQPLSQSPAAPAIREDAGPPESTFLADDGRAMLLVNAKGAGNAFYSHPRLVTFHHYVDFLNEIAEELTVSEGVVQREDEVWIYLGDGSAPYEVIFFQNGRFRIRDAAWAAKPVVRVTWLGARAYARYYNKQLPDFEQWQALMAWHARLIESTEVSQQDSGNDVQEHVTAPHFSAETDAGSVPANGQGNAGADQVMKEWLADRPTEGTYRIVGRAIQTSMAGQAESLLRRHPWEGFADVGFRTIVVIDP